MKRFLSFIIAIILFLGCIAFLQSKGQVVEATDSDLVKHISEKIIRFHVLANSNTNADQDLKLKVKDEVINYITPKLENSNSIDESRKILKENNGEIIRIAERCIKDNGYNYSVKTSLGRENFPVKVYGNITLPQGEYEAFRILIGEAEGQNWWCVMFPPLCFVDVSKGQINYNETEEQMKSVLTDDELNEVVDNKVIMEEDEKIEFKFKFLEMFEEAIFSK